MTVITRAKSIDGALDILNAALEDSRNHLVTVERDGYGDTFWIRVRRRSGRKIVDDAEVGDVVGEVSGGRGA